MISLPITSAEKDGINGIQNKWMRLMRNNIIYLICAACLVAACAEEQRFENINPTPGVEVAFSAITNESPETKTLYGADADDVTGLKVKWVNGDKIKIYGTTCSVKEAEYSVQATTAATNTPNTDDGQNYADDLIKTGAAGVQWGSEGTSDFYAVYPSDGASFTQNSDGSVKINTTINATQNYLFNDEPTTIGNLSVWEGTHFGSDATDPSMLNAIMYAYTKGATPTDESGNTKQVDLHFKPFSTVFKFRFMGYTSEISNVTDPTVYVQSITITAPEGYNISGDFSLAITGDGGKDVSATATATGNNSNSITLNTILGGGTYLPLRRDQAVDFNVFTIPLENLMLGGDITKKEVTNTDGTKKTYVTCAHPWKVTIKTQTHGTFEYTVIPNVEGITELAVGSTLTAKAYELNAGHIHKIKVPKLTLKTEFNWNPENWITQIPVPVYISELSVPGAWYCFDPDYQNTTDLATLYKSGIRAFNIDCRISKKNCNDHRIFGNLGAESGWEDENYFDGKGYLACAGSEPMPDIGFSNAQIISNEGTYVKAAVTELINLAQDNTKEYIVIVFTFAEKPVSNSGTIFGSVRPDFILNELNTILNTSGIKEYLYTDITKDTTIDDITKTQSDGYVKNVIVKINHCTDNFYANTSFLSFNHDNNDNTSPVSIIPAGLMGSFGSMSSNPTYNLEDDIITNIAGLHSETTYTDYFTTMRTDAIYIGTNESDLQYCYHQAQNTSSSTTRGEEGTGIPTLGMRMDAIDDIIGQSKNVYDNAKHDHWFQMGIGGSIDGDNPSGVSNVLNPYLYGKIMKKMDTDPSPVGIVLMNHATSTTKNTITVDGTEYKDVTSQDLVQAIIEMNGKFYLNRVGGSITTGDGTGSGSGSGSGSTTPSKNAAYAVVGDNAF